MLLKMYVVYDCKSETYTYPMCYLAKGEAIREFIEMSNDVKTKIGKHPEDYTFFEVGTYCNTSSKFDLYATPVSLGKAIEFVRDYVGVSTLAN